MRVGVLRVGEEKGGRAAHAWIVVVERGFSGSPAFDLSWFQPLGAAALTWAVIRWARGRPTLGSGTGGI